MATILQHRGVHKREKKVIDDKFGPRGSKEREQASEDLHGDKRKRGGGNDKNKSWDELDDYKRIELVPQPAPPPVPTLTPNPNVAYNTDGITVGDFGKAAVVTGATVAGGYVIYRGVRMLPSLLPPLWWTIPANAVCP